MRREIRILIAWLAAIVCTLLAAGLLLEIAKYGILLVHGLTHGLPYRISLSVASIAVFSTAFVAPATVARMLWAWLFRATEPASVTLGILLVMLVLAWAWPTLLANEIATTLGR